MNAFFTSYSKPWVAECMHFCVVFFALGGRMYVFLRRILCPGWQNERIFTSYSKPGVAERMYVYMVILRGLNN